MNDTFAGLENEFQEANEKFDVLLSMPINDDDDKEETNLLHNLLNIIALVIFMIIQ